MTDEPFVSRALVRYAPPRYLTEGPGVADLATQAGFAPDDEQRAALDDIFAEDEHGRPASFEDVTVAPRQNIKTGLFKICILGWLFLTGERRVVYTAHEAEPALSEMLSDLRDIIDANSWLSRRVRGFYEGNGQQRIDLMDGRKLLMKPRTKGGGRSLAGDKVILDEGLFVTGTQLGTLVPTMSTRPNAQLVWGSSPPKAHSIPLHDVMDRLAAKSSPSLSGRVFGAPPPAESCARGDDCRHERDAPGCGCDKPELWWKANPAHPHRITLHYIRNERQTLPTNEFAVERMGWGEKRLDVVASGAPFTLEQWEDLVDEDPANAPDLIRAFAIEQDLDHVWTSIVGAGKRDDDRVHVEVFERERDLDDEDVVQLAVDINADEGPATFAIDERGPAKALAAKLREAGLQVEDFHTDDVTEAYKDFVGHVRARTVAHGPQAELDAAVLGAKKRPVGSEGGYAFGRRKSDADITPLIGAAHAVRLCEALDYDLLDSIG